MRPKTRLVVVVVALSLLAAGLVLFLVLYPVWTAYREYQEFKPLMEKGIKGAVEELREPAPQPEPSSPGNVKRDDAKPDGAKRDR